MGRSPGRKTGNSRGRFFVQTSLFCQQRRRWSTRKQTMYQVRNFKTRRRYQQRLSKRYRPPEGVTSKQV